MRQLVCLQATMIAYRSDVRKASRHPDTGTQGHNFLAHSTGVTFHWNTCDPVESILSNALGKAFRPTETLSYWTLLVAGDHGVDCRAMLFSSTVRDVLESIREMCVNGCGAFDFTGLVQAPANPTVYIAMSPGASDRYFGHHTAVRRITQAFVTTDPPESDDSAAFTGESHWIILHPHAGLLPNSHALPRCTSVGPTATVGDVLSEIHRMTLCSGPYATGDRVYFECIHWIAPGVVEVHCDL